MKRILITGKNSYIGESFKKWACQLNKTYQIDSISLRDGKWREYDFTSYNVVIHVAAIVHKKNVREQLYYEINRDLAYEVANTAKKAGVEQFIFFSTMSVFGLDSGVIDGKTKLEPKTAYGKSKLEAEKEIIKLKGNNFLVAIVRPPMIYGPKAVGNYAKLSKLAKKTPIFPRVNNQRSMLYIDNLSNFLAILIDNNLEGEFHPQNSEYVNTSDLVKKIGRANNKNIVLLKGFAKIIHQLTKFMKIFQKVFGSLVYKNDSYLKASDYEVYDFEETIKISERGV